MYKKILCPVDGSDTSNRGLHEAIALAKVLNSQLMLLHVVDLYFPIMGINEGFDSAEVDEILRNNGHEVMEKALQTARAAGVNPESKILEAMGHRVSKLVLQEAQAWPADLIVMGTHGLRGIKRFIIGSDAETVTRTCKMPILLVKKVN